MNEEEAIINEMLKNPKIKGALKGLLAPLKQEGDSLIIKTSEEKQDGIKIYRKEKGVNYNE